ncbi:heat-inducible transcriptional repressor HrcA [Sulfurivermis fontis]|uniref:heat-inducible transcriptional repressor HrcA n=1 Tax=Sulfurivermis fontis TaxID=1972068 RepID=UPI000FDA593D|nr:heat-inducible transcriptional repressor HrcA [Sulfurivermis fontis]
MSKVSSIAMSDRAQQLLKLLVERYIREGQPVGSRTLARGQGVDLSPATIRNVMADLEDLGLVKAPHTSAGRIPTVQGYRLFVDSLLTVKPLQPAEVRALQAKFEQAADPQQVLVTASALLSEISSMAGVIMVPRREQPTVRQVEFIALSGNRVLVVLVLDGNQVQNRMITTSRRYSPAELTQAANYLNHALAGKDFTKVRDTLLREMRETQESINQLMLMAIEIANRTFKAGEEGGDYVLAGHTNLMGYAEMADIDRLRQLFEAFNRKRDILHLLDQAAHAQGVQIFIGEESGYEVLDACSVVTSPYEVDGEVVGVLGVIGPTRMAYDRLIPLVDVTAKLLGAALNQQQ